MHPNRFANHTFENYNRIGTTAISSCAEDITEASDSFKREVILEDEVELVGLRNFD
jgi:hypothetical protein